MKILRVLQDILGRVTIENQLHFITEDFRRALVTERGQRVLIPTNVNILVINVLIMQYVWIQKELIFVHAKKAIQDGPMINHQARDPRSTTVRISRLVRSTMVRESLIRRWMSKE